jgi:hypothetical protein
MNNLICGCEQGGDCTKTTVCAIDTVTEDLRDRIVELEDQIASATKLIDQALTSITLNHLEQLK